MGAGRFCYNLSKRKEAEETAEKEGEKEVKMRYDDWDEKVRLARTIYEYASPDVRVNFRKIYTQNHYFPTVKELEAHEAEKHLEALLLFFIYYAEVYESNDPEYAQTRKYLKQLLYRNIEFVD